MTQFIRKFSVAVGFVAISLCILLGFIPAFAQTPATHPISHRSSQKKVNASVGALEPVKSYGSKNAPITMEVFSDFECPSCRGLYEQTLRPLMNDYVASGKVYLVHKDFPLPIHQYSYEAARWANAAARIGRFGEAEAALYDNQATWAADGNIRKCLAAALSPAEMKRVEKLMEGCAGTAHVAPAGLRSGQGGSQTCALDAGIEKDAAEGRAIPVTQTPTSMVIYKGQRYPVIGIVSYPILKQLFDQLLRQ